MQTKQQIRQLLASAGAFPNKRLGQHFLIDLNLMRLLVESANIDKNDIVLEVGCGTGSLTEALAEKAGMTIAVEYDRTLAEIAKSRLAEKENVEIINTDILENKHTISHTVTNALSLVRRSCPGRILLVANLPYNAACPVILNLITGPTIAEAMYVTVQKEIAVRMSAGPGSGDYGILSIFLGSAGDVKTIRTLKRTVFWPQPQVDSAMVAFVREEAKASRIRNMELFAEIISLFMGHRRKTLLACTKLARGKLEKIHDWGGIFEKSSVDSTQRPEQIRPEDYVAIANLCCAQSPPSA